jgi:hypothetical protein
MTQAFSLHIGLNEIDKNAYGTDGKLENCLNDCDAMARIATENRYTVTQLKDSEATCARVTAEIARAARELNSGDIFLLTYAGHGSQVPDNTGEEEDSMNETWVLYDRMMVDNELYRLWSTFRPGVKIFVLSDSCHSGTMMRPFLRLIKREIRQALGQDLRTVSTQKTAKKGRALNQRSTVIQVVESVAISRNVLRDSHTASKGNIRLLPLGNSLVNYYRNQDLYDTTTLIAGTKRSNEVVASLIYISGCQDNQTSSDGPPGTSNGLFTSKVIEVWANGTFSGSHKNFHSKILEQMPAIQTPNYMTLGTNLTDFENKKPFILTVDSASVPGPISPVSQVPSLELASPWRKSDGPPEFVVNTAGNPLFYVELATDARLFNRAANESQRTEQNFYASYDDRSTWNGNSFLMAGNRFRLPEAAWNRLSAASRLFYRIGSSTNLQWGNFKISCADDNCFAAPSFELLAVTTQPEIPVPVSGISASPGQPGSLQLSAPVGEGQPNKKADVKLVQALLNKVPVNEGGPEQKLAEDGLYGDRTKHAIQTFQMFWGYDATETLKVVTPDSETFHELANYSERAMERELEFSENEQHA